MGQMRPRACCRRDVANHDGERRSRPLPGAPARQLRTATPGAGAARSGPCISGPSSISLPGLNMFPTSRVGPSSSVDRNRGAERKADHPRRGFQFPDLRLKSTRRLADRRPQSKNCKFFFQVERSPCRNPFWSFLPSLVTSIFVCSMITSNRPPPGAEVLLENDRSETNQIVLLRSTRGSGFSFVPTCEVPRPGSRRFLNRLTLPRPPRTRYSHWKIE